MSARLRVLAIVGPTGTGKSELAIEVARRTDAEIISADSMQVYRGMDIGTAKPSAARRSEIPHHAIDIVDPDDPMTAGRYAAHARAAARRIAARGRPIILCGGTGLYARAFGGGLVAGVQSSAELREELEKLSGDELIERLRARDPLAAQKIHPNNRVRLVRAIEICELGGESITTQHSEHGFRDRPFELIWLALDAPRELLWERLAARTDAMFRAGFVAEVEGLYVAGYGPELPALRSIGYREVGQLLAGEIDEAEARERVFVATRRFARRQRTWFRAEPDVEWLDVSEPRHCLERALRELGA